MAKLDNTSGTVIAITFLVIEPMLPGGAWFFVFFYVYLETETPVLGLKMNLPLYLEWIDTGRLILKASLNISIALILWLAIDDSQTLIINRKYPRSSAGICG